MRTTAEYLSILRTFYRSQAAKYGITRMGIFGSVARGEQTEDSDVDICYEGTAPTLLVSTMLINFAMATPFLHNTAIGG